MIWADIFVTLGNFIVLILFFVIVFKRLRGTLEQEIVKEKEHVEHLVDSKNDLKVRVQEVEQACKDQDLFCKQLAKKVALWHEKFDENKEAILQQHEQLKDILIERSRQQILLRKKQRMQGIIIPVAVEQARLELTEKFQKLDGGTQYVARIVNSTKKS